MTDDADINSNPEENRLMAAGLVPVLRDMQASLTTLSVELAKWIVTSLLAINGAGILAVWPSNLPIGFKVASCVVFLGGMLSAMLSGYFALTWISKAGRPLGEMIGYWISVQSDGYRAADLEDFDVLAKLKGAWPSSLTGWLAAILFVLGAAVAGWGGYSDLVSHPSATQSGKRP